MSNVVLFRLRERNALVGVVEDKTTDTFLLSHVAVVRFWGTTKGFPQLCAGPTSETILDIADLPPGTLAEVPRLAVHYTLPANETAWRKALRCPG